jgi:exopolysaccharide production protein ExoQ
MAPNAALALCCLFVMYLLRLDMKQGRGLSAALWIPTVWMMYCGSRPLAAWFGDSDMSQAESGVEAGSPMDRAFLIVLLVLTLLTLARRRLNWSEILRDNRWLFALFGYMALSVLWSNYDVVSFKRWIRSCGSILVALIVLSESAPRQALESVLRRSIYVLIPFSVLLVKYFSEIGHDYNQWTGERMWVGVTTQKNCLGRLCLLSAFFLFWQFFKRWRHKDVPAVKHVALADGTVLLLTLLLLRGSSSATSFAVLVLGILTFLGLYRIREWLARAGSSAELAAAALVIGLGIGYLLIGETILSAAVGSLGRDMTFTGRTEIWELLVPIAAKHPILGLGYGGFWINSPLPWPGLNEGHNGYLDVVLELGVVGLLLLGMFLAYFYAAARRGLTQDFDMAAFNISFLVMAVIHNCTESSFVRSTTHLWTFTIFLAIVSPQVYRLAGRKNEHGAVQVDVAGEPRARFGSLSGLSMSQLPRHRPGGIG